MLIAPALGVPRRFYQPFAQFLADEGYDVLSIDYRGIGESGRDGDVGSIRLADWGRLDVDAALRWLWENSQAPRRVLVGHSLGGQLPGLTPESEGLAALVLVGASCPDPRLYPLLPRLRMLLLWRVLTPLLSRNRPYFPARRIGFSSVDVPAGAMRDWARWGLSSDCLFDPRSSRATRPRRSTGATSTCSVRMPLATSAISTRGCATACGRRPPSGWMHSTQTKADRTDACGTRECARRRSRARRTGRPGACVRRLPRTCGRHAPTRSGCPSPLRSGRRRAVVRP